MLDEDLVFKALADRSRRLLLDRLRANDGQPLTSLSDALPDMTRFGVMKHLRVLEAAHLVVTEKRGRQRLHFLNPVPIREIHDRWISHYAAPHIDALVALRTFSETAAGDTGTITETTPEPSPTKEHDHGHDPPL